MQGELLWGSVFFLSFQFCGMVLAHSLLPKESGGARLLFGSVIGSVLLTWSPIPFSFVLGFTKSSNLWGLRATALLTILVILLTRKQKSPPLGLSAFLRKRSLWVVAVFCVFFCLLVWRSFRYENGRVYSSQATYGDMCMHLGFITSIAKQGTFPPHYSILPTAQLSYPFLSDSISSSLCLFGMPLRAAYALPMFFAGAQVFFGFFLLAQRVLKSHKKALLAFVLFFCNGGFGYVYFLGSKEEFSHIFTDFYRTPTNLVEQNIRWVNVIVDMMLPQRATLFGWAILFPTLYLLYRAVFEGERRYFLWGGIMAGLLPMVHTHSFLAVVLVCGAWLIFSLLKKLDLQEPAATVWKILVALAICSLATLQRVVQKTGEEEWLLPLAIGIVAVCVIFCVVLLTLAVRRFGVREFVSTWGVLVLSAGALSIPQLCFWTFRQVGGSGMLTGHFGWVIADTPYLWFYLMNLGVAGVLALVGLLSAKSDRVAVYSPALIIWLLAELVRFQPNEYDNNKLLYVAYVFLCFAAAELVGALATKLSTSSTPPRRHFAGQNGAERAQPSRLSTQCVCGAAVVAIASCSAVLTMGREWAASYELFGEGALSLVEFVENNTEPDAVILTDTRHNNEIAAISGRNIVCGSSSYLYFHGLSYASYEQAVRQMYEQPIESAALFDRCGVEYILVSDFEQSSYQVNEQELSAMSTLLYDDGVRRLYQYQGGTYE